MIEAALGTVGASLRTAPAGCAFCVTGTGCRARTASGFSKVVAERMEATASGIERLATEGVAAHTRLVREGAPELVRAERAWVERHASDLDAALVEGV